MPAPQNGVRFLLAQAFALGVVKVKNTTATKFPIVTASGLTITIQPSATLDLAQQTTIADLQGSTSLFAAVDSGWLQVLPPPPSGSPAPPQLVAGLTLDEVSAVANQALAIAKSLQAGGVVATPIVINISPSGNDGSGDGSSGNPYQSLQKALAMMPLAWASSAQINLAPGTYPAFSGSIFTGLPSGPNATPLTLVGTPTMVVGPTNVTGTAGGLTPSITATSLSMTPGAMRGNRLRFLSGANANLTYTIWDNTGTQITVSAAGFQASVSIGDQFVIESWPVVPVSSTSSFAGGKRLNLQGVVLRVTGAGSIQVLDGTQITTTSVEADLGGLGAIVVVNGSITGNLFTGLYVHNQALGTAGISLVGQGRCALEGQVLLRTCDVECASSVMDIAGLTASTSSIAVTGGGVFFHNTNQWSRYQGSMNGGNAGFPASVYVDSASQANLRLLDISGSPADGIFCQGQSYLVAFTVTGSGNAGAGLHFNTGATALVENGSSITGSTPGTNDVNIGGTLRSHAAMILAGGFTDSVELTRVKELA